MLTGFEELTCELTEQEERVLLPVIVRGLRAKVGRAMAVTNKAIVEGLRVNMSIAVTAPRIRKIINYIRCKGMVPCLIATSEGYYVAETEQELLDYEESLRGREAAIREVRECIAAQRKNKYNNNFKQMTLWN